MRDRPCGAKADAVDRIVTKRAEFARLGGLHRNTFLNSPKLLDATLRLKANPRWRFAGQITGCEGYVDSAAIGLLDLSVAHPGRLIELVVLVAANAVATICRFGLLRALLARGGRSTSTSISLERTPS